MSEVRDTRIEIPEEAREGLVGILNSQLADATDLYTQVKFAHWNVEGSDFIQLHELFDEVAAHVLEFTDLIAERATTLGGKAHGTLRQAAAGTSLSEYPDGQFDGMDAVAAVADQVGAYAASTRQAIEESDKLGDAASSDLFTEVARQIDKDLWFLEAHLQSTD
jgi:starvation-inducible DNA-binding protein